MQETTPAETSAIQPQRHELSRRDSLKLVATAALTIALRMLHDRTGGALTGYSEQIGKFTASKSELVPATNEHGIVQFAADLRERGLLNETDARVASTLTAEYSTNATLRHTLILGVHGNKDRLPEPHAIEGNYQAMNLDGATSGFVNTLVAATPGPLDEANRFTSEKRTLVTHSMPDLAHQESFQVFVAEGFNNIVGPWVVVDKTKNPRLTYLMLDPAPLSPQPSISEVTLYRLLTEVGIHDITQGGTIMGVASSAKIIFDSLIKVPAVQKFIQTNADKVASQGTRRRAFLQLFHPRAVLQTAATVASAYGALKSINGMEDTYQAVNKYTNAMDELFRTTPFPQDRDPRSYRGCLEYMINLTESLQPSNSMIEVVLRDLSSAYKLRVLRNNDVVTSGIVSAYGAAHYHQVGLHECSAEQILAYYKGFIKRYHRQIEQMNYPVNDIAYGASADMSLSGDAYTTRDTIFFAFPQLAHATFKEFAVG